MKYIDADKLKAKLDEHYRKYQSMYMETRIPYTQGLIDALDLAEQVIDSLQQEQPKGLEEAAQKVEDYYDVGEEHGYLCCHRGDIKNTFIAGAGWDRAKILEGAVEADVNTYEDVVSGVSWAEFVVKMPAKNLGNKVKIIIVKEDDKWQFQKQ